MDDMQAAVQPPTLGGYLRHLRNTSQDRSLRRRAAVAVASDTSVGYLTKLEQGQQINPSPEIVDRLATALKASDAQRQHLHDLVAYHHVPPGSVEDDGQVVITNIMRVHVDSLVPHLAGFVDHAWNVLYANTEYRRIYRHIADPEVGNVLVWFFMVPESKAIMLDWEAEAQLTVAWLRSLMVRRPGSRTFWTLLKRLSVNSDFLRMWKLQEVLLGRRTPYMWVHDLDHNLDIQLSAQVHTWPDPTEAIQLYLGVRATTDA